MKKYKKFILKLVVSVGLVGIILWKVDRRGIIESIRSLDFRYVPLIFGFLILNYVVSSFRWKLLLIHKNSEHITVSYLTSLYFIGAFFNNIMPTSMGGDVYKIYRLGKKLDCTVDAFSATFMERFTGMIALVLISIVGLTQVFGFLGILAFVGLWVGFFAGLWVLKFFGGRYKKLKKIYDSLVIYKGRKKVLLWAFITSLAVQIIAIATQYFVFLAVGIHLPVAYSLFIFPVITLAGFFIPSLNGIGVQDALYIQMFSVVGVTTAVSLSVSILYHVFRLGTSLIGGMLYAMGKDD